MIRRWLPLWTWLSPLAGWALLAGFVLEPHPLLMAAIGAALIACVLAAVHHAEIVAHRVGQPLGGSRHREQAFGIHGVSAALATLATLAVMILILPNATIQAPGPAYSPGQLAFVGVVSLVLYLFTAIVP